MHAFLERYGGIAGAQFAAINKVEICRVRARAALAVADHDDETGRNRARSSE